MASTVHHCRVDEEDLEAYIQKAKEMKFPSASDATRTLLKAFAEGRLTIRPSDEERERLEKQSEIYKDV